MTLGVEAESGGSGERTEASGTTAWSAFQLESGSASYSNSTVYADGQIPEPSTLVLLTVGLFGLLAYAWRKRK